MNPEQQRLLAEKRTANHQQWLASRYLAALGTEVRDALSLARVVVRPESDALNGYRLFREAGLGLEPATRPTGYTFVAYDRAEDLFAAVEAFGTAADGFIGYFCPTGFMAREDGGRWSSSGDPPMLQVGFGWARSHFPKLHAAAHQACSLISACGGAGILTRVVCGYPDRHADDPVFEAALWSSIGS